MKIVRQLADWLLDNGRITPEYYNKVLTAILGKVDADGLNRAFAIQKKLDDEDRAVEDWWNLRGAGERAKGKTGRRKGGRKGTPNATPIKVWDLDRHLPDVLLPRGANPEVFPLAVLLIAIDEARGNRRSKDWAGFAAAATELYKLGAEQLHDALLAAMKICGRKLGPILIAAEKGSTLFPEGFLSKFSGESVDALRKLSEGEETAFSVSNNTWILRYSSFNILNEACLLRNRLRRVFRLWVRELSEWDVSEVDEDGQAGAVCLVFGKTHVPVPVVLWWKLQDPAAPKLGSIRGITAFPFPNHSPYLNILVDGAPVVLYHCESISPTWVPWGFWRIRGPGLADLPSPVQILWPFVSPHKRTPCFSLPKAPETVCWTPSDWANAVVSRRILSSGVPAESECPWDVLRSHPPSVGWINIILYRPELAQNIPWQRMDLKSINGYKWTELLLVHPEYSSYAQWEEIDCEDLERLFLTHSVLIENCNIDSISRYCLNYFLKRHPDYAEPCIRRLSDGSTLLSLLSDHPEWAEYCPWQSLAGFNTRIILEKLPEFADRCVLNKLDGGDWTSLLGCQPQLADRCDWSKLSSEQLSKLLEVHPELSSFIPSPA